MTNRCIISKIILVIVTISILPPLHGEVARGKVGLGINYPGMSLKYFPSKKLALEMKGQFDKDIMVGGLRMYHYFNDMLFTGLEVDYVTYKTEESEGIGYVGEVFIGLEFFFTRNLSIQMDMGPVWVRLKDTETGVMVEGTENVVNFGINWYIGGTEE